MIFFSKDEPPSEPSHVDDQDYISEDGEEADFDDLESEEDEDAQLAADEELEEDLASFRNSFRPEYTADDLGFPLLEKLRLLASTTPSRPASSRSHYSQPLPVHTSNPLTRPMTPTHRPGSRQKNAQEIIPVYTTEVTDSQAFISKPRVVRTPSNLIRSEASEPGVMRRNYMDATASSMRRSVSGSRGAFSGSLCG